jgi:RimJ/RimL family protein N-acetyltransferase
LGHTDEQPLSLRGFPKLVKELVPAQCDGIGFLESPEYDPRVIQRRTLVRIEPWGEADLPLLQKTLGDPEMTQHIGGPESADKIAERQSRRERPGSRQYKIAIEETGEAVGWVGYWDKDWRDDHVYEIGWSVLTPFQGRGIGAAATELAIGVARAEQERRYVHAFPSVTNAPSNAICRKVGFSLLEEGIEFEYPPGNTMRCNDWRFDLFPSSSP